MNKRNLIAVTGMAFCLLFITMPAISQVTDTGSSTLRILTFNILHGATTRGDFDLDAIAKVINDANPDLVALQEVDFKTNRAKKLDLATELAYRCHMVPLFAGAMNYDGGQYGEALLSKYSFIETKNHALPFSGKREPRAAAEGRIVLPSGDTISFIGTHLDHVKNSPDRIAQVKRINEVFTVDDRPKVLAGDLNDVPGSDPIRILQEKWQPSFSGSNARPTFPSDSPSVKIDYIMYYPKSRWEVVKTRVICDKIASDHCAYLTVLKLK